MIIRPRNSTRPIEWLATLSIVFASCSDPGVTSGFSVSDSAGVEIVQNRGPMWGAESEWHLARSPRIVIGREGQGEDSDLFRVVAAKTLDDGSIVVANSGTSEIKIFDRTGSFLRSFGRRGEGPGEFRSLVYLTVSEGDTILAWDSSLEIGYRFMSSGELVEQNRRPEEARPRFINGCIPVEDGTLFCMLLHRESIAHRPSTPIRSLNWVVRLGRIDATPDTLGAWPGSENIYVDVGGDPRLGSKRALAVYFSPNTEMASGGDPERVVIGDGAVPEVKVYSPEGTLLRIVRWTPRERIPSDDDLRAARASRLRGPILGGSPEAMARLLEELPPEVHVPHFRRLAVDSGGNIWVERYPLPTDTLGAWTVFDSHGRWQGIVDTPLGIRPMEIGEDLFMALGRTELDVQVIQLFDLVKGG